MPTNWPPTNAPAWPPPEINPYWVSYSDLTTAKNELASYGFTWRNPTNTENSLYFKGVKCDEGHNVNGVMIISPAGVAYPFAYCVATSHRDFLVLWSPYYCGFGSS